MTKENPPGVRVVSYNIRKAMGTDRRRDPMRILTILSEINSDIVILQEADLRLGERPAALPLDRLADTGFTPLPLADTDVSLGWHGNAVLVRSDWAADQLTRIPLPGLEPRGAVSARIATPHGRLRVIGMHLGLLRRSRQAQQHALIDWLDTQPGCPSLIAGDLNEWSPRRGLAPLAQHFNLLTPGHSFHARWRLAPLDRIGLGAGLSLRHLDLVDTQLTRRASDHLPIRAEIVLPATS